MPRLFWWITGLLAGVGLMAAQANAGMGPQELVKQTSERMLEALRAEEERIKKDPQRLRDLVDEIVLPHFDFERMSKLVLGRYWRRADEGQQRRFISEFRELLVRTYKSALNEYSEQTISYLPFRGDESEGDVTVKTEVDQGSGFPIPIDYSLHLKEGEWKVYDVTIDGVSLVINYRSSFANEIRQVGIDGLIDKLRSRNEQEKSG